MYKTKLIENAKPLLVAFSLCISFWAGQIFAESNEELDELVTEDSKTTPLPLEQIKTFAEIFTRIKVNYVSPVSDEQLLDYAIRGMLNGLDPHSMYLKDERYEELNEDTTGQFGGLGLEVMMVDGFLKVVAPIDDTPAAEAGIRTGDIILRIDGATVSGESLSEATKQMRGEPGTRIMLTIYRETEADPFDVELERAVVNINTVKQRWLGDGIGYIRISQFQSQTAESFRRKLKELRDKEEFRGLILDLRNNPGGLLNSAVAVADTFIEEGILVSTKGRSEVQNQVFMATPKDMIDGKPIVVLINNGSASASEIVAGALQDHERALILGLESFGKGSVQTVVEVGELEAIKLTTARYYTPNGKSIQASGIVPDIQVEPKEFKQTEKRLPSLKESDLTGHLENEDRVKGKKPPSKTKAEKPDAQLARDYQLNEAFNLLKGLVLFAGKTTKVLDPSPSPEKAQK